MNTPFTSKIAALLATAAPLLLAWTAAPSLAWQDAIPAPSGADPAQAAAPAPEVVMLRLRDGSIHWGGIVEHDPDGLRFSLLSHGGLVRVPWSLLDPAQEQALRERFGYVDVSSEELMIDAERLILKDGREVVGVIVSRQGDAFLLKAGGNVVAIPKDRVASITKGQRVPALDVYSREEIYNQYNAEAAADDSRAQLELARICERILDFAHAVEHYEAVLALDPEYDAQDVQAALERARVKALQQEQIDYLRAADTLRKKRKYDEALAMLDAFGDTFPDSPLHLDAAKKRDRVLQAREEAIRDLVRKRWFHWMRRLSREAAKLDYQGALAYAEETMSEDIQARVLADVQKQISADIQPDHVLAFWATRKKVRYQPATYGLGTWLLGEDRALAGTKAEEEAAKPQSETDAKRKALEERIARFMRNQQLAARARSRQEEADSYDAFWSAYPFGSRGQWILAYYAEFSGDLELRDHPTMRPCAYCGGKGAREIIYTGGGAQGSGGTQLVKCADCQGIGSVRKVYFR